MTATEAYWIPHCDEWCGLGVFEYECPVCHATISSCNLWWHYDDTNFHFECEECLVPLMAYWDAEELETKVINEDP
jgi:hypothetical protein